MSQAMRKLTAVIGKSKTALVFINQIRMKIGVMFGNPETTPGGRALKFYSTVRIDLRRLATIKEGGIAIGNRVRARVVKNKIAPPFRESEFDLMFDSGISYEGDLLDLGLGCEIVEKSGAWLNYGDIRLGQGRENAKKYLAENKDLCEELKNKVLVAKGLVQVESKIQNDE
jgi:recombination protein RecA